MKETEQEKETPKRGRILGIFKSKYARHFIGKYKWNYLIGILILIFIDIKQTDVPIIVGDSINAIDARNLPERSSGTCGTICIPTSRPFQPGSSRTTRPVRSWPI